MISKYLYSNQTVQHNTELRTLELIQREFGKANVRFTSELTDLSKGIDLFIYDKPYDLKASNSNKITIFRITASGLYCPLLKNKNVEYLFPTEVKGIYKVITKQEIFNEFLLKYWMDIEEKDLVNTINSTPSFSNCKELERILYKYFSENSSRYLKGLSIYRGDGNTQFCMDISSIKGSYLIAKPIKIGEPIKEFFTRPLTPAHQPTMFDEMYAAMEEDREDYWNYPNHPKTILETEERNRNWEW